MPRVVEMKAIWNGAVSFGLVNIPVKLYAAVEQRPVTFKLLHEKDGSPIEYRRWCSKGEHEVPWSEVVKGVDLGDGEFYVFSKQELASLKPKKTDLIEIVQFVEKGSLDRVYVDAHYYIGPEKPGLKAFFLLQETLTRTQKMAIGSFVMREREYVCGIEPYGPGLLLTTLNYVDEVRSMGSIPDLQERPELRAQEIELAEQLIEKLTVKSLDISRFKDRYHDNLKEAVEKRDAKHLVTVEEEVKATPEPNLLDALKASLEG
jgi:DNA end-binding protein Ku